MLSHKIEQMKEEMSLYSKTQDSEHLEDALKMRDALQEKEHLDLHEQLVINTKELFESGFQFPSVAQYENVQNQLTEILNAQDNLNQNLENPILQTKFAKAVEKVRNNFAKGYSTSWNDPKNSAE